MKKLYYIFSFILALMFLLTSCQDDDHELGRMLSKSEIDFEVIQDYTVDEGGNTVILRNYTSNIVPMWDYGTGRSNRVEDTVRFPFKGEYTIKFSALTAGGIVEMEPVIIEVTEDNLDYVNDPLWTALTGGVGNSKTWILDNGKYGLAPGPLSYADPSRNQIWADFQPNWEPLAAEIGATDEDMAAEMTFSLMGGPFVATVKPNEEGGNESGTFSLDTEGHTLSTTDATIIRVASFIPNASNWNQNLNILELNENQLRVGVMRTNEEGSWWYIWNYVSKEYAENYVPGYTPDPNFDHGDQLQILAGNSATTWKLSTETPFNWTKLTGEYLNNWYSSTDYPDWTGYDAAAAAGIENVRITFTRTGDVILKQNDGSTEQGIYSIDEGKNLISFEGIKPSVYISGGWVTAGTTDEFKDDAGNIITGDNQWKIVKIKRFAGIVTDVWFGKRDVAKPEYMVYHFVLDSDVPNFTREVTRLLAGGLVGESSRTFKIDTNWPVDWINPLGEGWTIAGTQDDWYWNENIANSVIEQTVTFMQIDGAITMTKRDEQGNTSSSPVTIDADNKTITIPDTNIIQFGGDSWLPTAGPEYNWIKGEYSNGTSTGFWIGLPNNDENTEYVAYHYILAE